MVMVRRRAAEDAGRVVAVFIGLQSWNWHLIHIRTV